MPDTDNKNMEYRYKNYIVLLEQRKKQETQGKEVNSNEKSSAVRKTIH